MGKYGTGVPADKLKLYELVVSQFEEVKLKGAKSAYTSVNGHMFSFMTEEGLLALRLSADEREAFQKKFKTGPVIQYDTAMKEYIGTPNSLLKNTSELKDYFEMSYRYACSLKPKPTKRK